MKKSFLIIVFIYYSMIVFCQEKSLIHIYNEKQDLYKAYSKTAKKNYSWIINGTPIKYFTNIYNVKIIETGIFDTIIFKEIYKRGKTIHNRNVCFRFFDIFAKTKYDTIKTLILCKFRNNHNYKIGQIFPGHFEMYSLDTMETKKTIIFKAINKKSTDTLYLNVIWTGLDYMIYSDTTINVLIPNDKLDESLLQKIQLNKKTRIVNNDDIIFNIYYQYLHAEKLEIIYDFENEKYKLKLVN